MSDAMVTGRMSLEKKQAGNEVLERAGLNASQAINRMYDRIIEEQDVGFLMGEKARPTELEWKEASDFLDSISLPWTISERFVGMSKTELKRERLSAKGLM